MHMPHRCRVQAGVLTREVIPLLEALQRALHARLPGADMEAKVEEEAEEAGVGDRDSDPVRAWLAQARANLGIWEAQARGCEP